jgi:DNA-binding LytR/AlgR family response regulator
VYRILVLEDDCIQRRTLSEIIRQCSALYQVYEADCVKEALGIAQRERIDLFYVDINLKKQSGMKFADEIRKMECYRLTWIIFVTIYKDYMLPAFKKIHCYDYIVKPYKAEDIQRVTKLLLPESREEAAAVKNREQFIIVPVKNIQVKIYTSDIIFVEVYLRTSIIHTVNGSFTIDYLSLKKLKSMIKDENILQSHRSYLVNCKYISKIEKTNDKTSYKIYFFKTDKMALLGQSYRKDIMDRFHNVSGWGEYE